MNPKMVPAVQHLLVRSLVALVALLALPAVAAADEAVTGTVAAVHGDDFRAGRPDRPGYVLRTPTQALRLSGAVAQPALRPGRRVTVTGRRRGRTLVVRRARALRSAAPVARAAVATQRNVAVLRVTLAGGAPQSFTEAQVRARVFTDADGVNAYYREVSREDLSLTGKVRSDGDVYGSYALATTAAACDDNAIRSQARAAAAAAGVDLTGYGSIVYIFPYTSGCSYSGLAYLPGQDSFINGTLATSVIAHELGHNINLHHAGSIRCFSATGQAVPYSEDCDFNDYGDPFDVMGNQGSRWLNNFHSGQRAWLNPGGTTTVSAPGDYAVGALEPPGTIPAAVRIPRGDSSYLYLEYRRPFGTFDAFSTTDPVVNGVSIRIAPDYGTVIESRLVDTVPATTSRLDAPLTAGRSFRDPVSGVTVTTLTDSGVASVHVEYGPAGDIQAPSAAGTLTGSAVGPRSVSLTWGAATDDYGVTGYRVERDGVFAGTASKTSYLDPTAPPGTTSTYTVRARDGAGNLGPPSNPVAVTTPVELASPVPSAPGPTTTTTTGGATGAAPAAIPGPVRVTQVPVSARVSAGVRRAGTAASLATADGRTYRVAAPGAATAGLVARFTGVSRAGADLVITYRGSASRSCVRSLFARRASGKWAEVARGIQPVRSATVIRTLRGPITSWLRGGAVEAQVRCHGARARSPLVLSVDRLTISNRRP